MTSGNINRSLGLSALVILSVAGLALTGSVAARADIDPTSHSATLTTTGNGDTDFTWSVIVTDSEVVNTGDYFTIYDFAGFVNNTALTVPAGWAESVGFSTPNVTAQFNSAGPNYNNPNIPDITFTYTGSTPLVGQQNLGNFTLESIYGIGDGKTVDAFAALAHQQSSGYSNANATQVVGPEATTGPHGGGTPVTPTPEPGVFVTAASMLSMTGLGLVRGRRRAKGVKVAA